uniref:NADH dehydrogenase subunit 3 n=1 Tax=Erythrolobus coxiae TaxID=362235 RepID=UPI001FCD4419|nr:NADH dehydrogenase subunit 3 [Erythrolobus coxiae]UNJ19002.1 NADH dehydrogenase subunit 3 [Erythrolobus coxiae]
MWIVNYEFLFIYFYFFISFILSFLIYFLSLILVIQNNQTHKLSSYECGFNPYTDARFSFDIRFYLIAILFLVFDLELSFLFPWCVTLNFIFNYGFWSMTLFLVILTFGFLYEWKKGALEWE